MLVASAVLMVEHAYGRSTRCTCQHSCKYMYSYMKTWLRPRPRPHCSLQRSVTTGPCHWDR